MESFNRKLKIYLTIDDFPSINTNKKIDFLKNYNIPAIFYARGQHIEKYKDQIVYAIKNNFLIGNHSYTHPHFSEITIEQCFNEILETEKLIDKCYEIANKKRIYKIFRFPYGDRGAGSDNNIIKNDKVIAIQKFLKTNNFQSVVFDSKKDDFIDSLWDLDTQDYKSKNIENKELYLQNLEQLFKNYKEKFAIILLHDFDNNHHLFETLMAFLINNNVEFCNYKII